MDRHDVSEIVTAEHVAHLHQQDLKIQHQFNCKGLTYWFDGKRKTAFCLIDAPNKEAIQMMHDKAHGEVPHQIIEVDDAVVESFLGRIEDPKKSQNAELNIINDPAFRTLMVIAIKQSSLKDSANTKLNLVIQNHNDTIAKTLNKFNGSIVKQKFDYFLASFDSVTNAVLCAMNIKSLTVDNTLISDVDVNMGLCAGVPVTESENIFEDTIKMAERFCNVVKGQIVISSEVKDLYESENLNISIDKKIVYALSLTDERFLSVLMDYVEREWRNTTLNIDLFIKDLGYSKSKLYRSMIPLTGKSPNTFIKEYRLNKALQLLNNQVLNISEIAYETGFNSPAYFTRAFKKKFGLLPTNFMRGSKTN
jgi:AraC-like DNA-binding protein